MTWSSIASRTAGRLSIYCDGTGVTTRFVLAEAQGGTFVEGCFTIEPNSIGMKVLGAVTGRRFMHSWLESSLENLKTFSGADYHSSARRRPPTELKRGSGETRGFRGCVRKAGAEPARRGSTRPPCLFRS